MGSQKSRTGVSDSAHMHLSLSWSVIINSLFFVRSQGAPLPHLGRDFAPERNQVCPGLLVGPSRPSPNQGAPGVAGGGGGQQSSRSPRGHTGLTAERQMDGEGEGPGRGASLQSGTPVSCSVGGGRAYAFLPRFRRPPSPSLAERWTKRCVRGPWGRGSNSVIPGRVTIWEALGGRRGVGLRRGWGCFCAKEPA